MDELGDVIGDIYEAACVPELWGPTLDRISALTGHDGGGIIAIPPEGRDPSFVASEIYCPAAAFLVEQGLARTNPFYVRTNALNYDGFVIDWDICTIEEWRDDPMIQGFARQFDAGHGTGTNIACPNGFNIGIRFARGLTGAPTERDAAIRLDALRPHLARATLTAQRFDLERARTAVLTLEALDLAAAALTRSGKYVVGNSGFDALTDLIRPAAFGRVRFVSPRLDALFGEALERFRTTRDPKHTSSIPAPAREGSPPTVVHLLPLVGAAQDVFGAAHILIMVTPLDRSRLPPLHLLRGLFDLTPAESTLTRRLLAGVSLDDIATGERIGVDTARKRLKAVFAKTGAHRQAELVALLSSLAFGAAREKD